MQRMFVKQILFLFFVVLALVGVFIHTNAKAQESKVEGKYGYFLGKSRLTDKIKRKLEIHNFRIMTNSYKMSSYPLIRGKYKGRSNLFSLDQWNWDEDWGEGRKTSSDFRYNRVEGLYTGIRIRPNYWRRRYPNRSFLYGSLGYAFTAKVLQYQVGLEKGFFDEYRLAFGGEYHKIVDTPDRWIIPDLENSLTAFFIKEDFQDFFLREGVSGYISQNFTQTLTLSAAYHSDTFKPLRRTASWALFGGKKQFRENPSMDSLEIRSVVGKLVLDSRNSKKRTTRGWYIQIEGEHAGIDFGSDLSFDLLLVDIRRYQPLEYGDGVDFRLRMGTSHGTLPWQRSFHLGGISTLRGFSYKAFPDGPMSPGGNRMILAQVEYRMGSQDLPDDLDLGILEHFNLIVFVDVGWVDNVGAESQFFDGFEKLTWAGLKNDVGIALANRSGNVRFEVARRTDTGDAPFIFYFRINRSF